VHHPPDPLPLAPSGILVATEVAEDARAVFSLGPLDYRAARGIRFGDSGLTLGGFATFELSRDGRRVLLPLAG